LPLANAAPLQRGEIDAVPVLHRLAEHRSLVPRVVRDQHQRMRCERRVIRVAIVGDLERRHQRADRRRDRFPRVYGAPTTGRSRRPARPRSPNSDQHGLA
jgi:hypothetical protein